MNTKTFVIRVALAAISVAAAPAPVLTAQTPRVAAAPAHGHYESQVEQSRALIDSLIRARNLPGVSIAVSIEGEVVWSEGFGFASIEQGTPVTSTTKFRVGSIAKPITAAAVAQLYEQGRLDLDAPVQQYVPSFPVKAKGTVTTRLLAGHLAGVRHYRGEEMLSTRRYENSLAGLVIFQDDTLQTPPGDAYSYSTYGWNLISVVVEGASGQEFLSYLNEHVFRPLGMRHTVADHTDSIIMGRTGYYDRTDDGRLINSPYVDNSYKWAGGGLLSTPEDLLRFANAHLEPGFLQPETVELLWTSQRTTAGEETGYGIGWRSATVQGHRVVSHSGGSVGGNSLLLVVPESKTVLAVTANISGAGYGNVPIRILQLFTGF